MNDDKKNITHYSAADIQRYVKGQMSSAEMHAIETAALDDPFLADAIEGFETALTGGGNEEFVKADLHILNRQLEERVNPPGKLVPMTPSRWWQIAAAALILIITSVALYNNGLGPDRNGNPLAVNKKQQPREQDVSKATVEESSSPSATFSDTLQNQGKKTGPPAQPSAAIILPPPAAKDGSQSHSVSEKKKSPDSIGIYNDQVTASGNIQRSERSKPYQKEITDKTKPEDDSQLKSEVAGVRSERVSADYKNQSPNPINIFFGRVVDPNNRPLSNVNLQVSKNRISLVTDQSGHFYFSTGDSVVDVQIIFPGFEQRNFRLQNSTEPATLVLEPVKQNLNEEAVTGYGIPRKKNNTGHTQKVQAAAPQIGWTEYEKYLEKNKKYPGSSPLMKGDVIVSFQVKRPGILSDFKIEKSLATDYDAEAIRLIQEGPVWKLKYGLKTRITVPVKF